MTSLVRFAAAAVVFLVFVATALYLRYAVVLRSRRRAMNQAWAAAKKGPVPDGVALPSAYIVYVLGSGGHTGELCEMIKQQFRPNLNSHRRYLITSGDQHSENAVAKLEGLIARTFPADTADAVDGIGFAGTWDIVRVARARHVHQPLWTTWWTSVYSAVSVVQVLLQPPPPRQTRRRTSSARPDQKNPDDKNAGDFRLPHLIVTNGPGTGFVVCLVAFALKMAGMVPANRCSVLFIETWAHVRTLSLTGKLFFYTRIADLFVVQHAPLAAATGARFIGEVAKHGNLLGIRKTLT